MQRHFCAPAPGAMRGRLLALLVVWLLATALASAEPGGGLVVYYGAAAASDAFDAFDVVVLDGLRHPPLAPLAERGKTVLGYLSLGEVASDKPHYSTIKAEGLLLLENPQWKGSFMVDLRDPRWRRFVVEHLVPGLLQQGFDGLFLDTLDDAAYLESLDPKAYRGMKKAAVRLVRAIRRHYPTITLMLNRGFDLIGSLDGDVDMWLGESTLADYDFAREDYTLVDEALYQRIALLLQAARTRHPRLRVFTLDYWDPEDPAGTRHIYQVQRAAGFEPYVATVALDRIVEEPED